MTTKNLVQAARAVMQSRELRTFLHNDPAIEALEKALEPFEVLGDVDTLPETIERLARSLTDEELGELLERLSVQKDYARFVYARQQLAAAYSEWMALLQSLTPEQATVAVTQQVRDSQLNIDHRMRLVYQATGRSPL